jgi:hypothetical protein
VTGPERETPRNLRGVWIAYHSDWSGFVAEHDELACLRRAVQHSMDVVSCPFGKDPRDVVRDAFTSGEPTS